MRKFAIAATFALSFSCAIAQNGASLSSDPPDKPKVDPLKPVSISSLGRSSCTVKKAKKETNPRKGYVVFGPFDVSEPCIPTQFETTVSNLQKVALEFKPPQSGNCTAVPTFKADAKADYGAIFAAFAKSAAGFAKFQDTGNYFDLPPASNGTLTVVITCDPAPQGVLPRTVIIHYRNAPLFSASAGSLVSFFPKRIYGVSTSQTGVGPTGVATTQNTVAITSSSKVQFVPIAFLNTHIYGPNQLHIDFQAGAGINPNGNKTEVEYFLGPALSTHGVYLSPGLHIARASYLTNGFALGEVIPSGVTPPVRYGATFRFAIAISYSPPVKSSN